MVNPKLLEAAERLGKNIEPVIVEPPQPVVLDDKILILDQKPVRESVDASKKSPDEWITYWNSIDDGRIMASTGEYYTVFKQLKKMAESSTVKDKEHALKRVGILREAFDNEERNNKVISSTRIICEEKSLDARIIQHYGDKNQGLVKECDLTVPNYVRASVNDVLDENNGLKFIQALFCTDDSKETIIGTLEFISGMPMSEIKVTTLQARDTFKDSAAGFYSDGDYFVVSCNLVYHSNLSFGVRYENPRQNSK